MASVSKYPSSMETDEDEDLSPEIQVLRNNRKQFVKRFRPSDFIDYLKCLTTRDRQRIQSKQDQEGNISATSLMFDCLVLKKIWWDDFIQALSDEDNGYNFTDIVDKLHSDRAHLEGTSQGEHGSHWQGHVGTIEGTVTGDPETYGFNMAKPPPGEKLCSKIDKLSLDKSLPNNSKERHNARNASSAPKIQTVANFRASGLGPKNVNASRTDSTGHDGTVPKTPYRGHHSREDSVADVIVEEEEDIDEDQVFPKRLDAGLEYGLKYSVNDINVGPPGDTTEWPFLLPSSINPRKYQEELAQHALKGDNCIICAPTNSGKTLVAIMITHAHLEMTESAAERSDLLDHEIPGMRGRTLVNRSISKPLVIVLVPRFALLQQVYKDFRCHLPLADIGKRGGGGSTTKRSLKSLATEKDIVIVTADILKNALRDGSMKLSDFTLMILDECHYTMNDHTYNDIMERYVREKKEGGGANLPQVLALTATPGAGKRIDIQSAKDSMMRLCANLDADYFVTVQEHQAELSEFTSTPTRDRIKTVSRQENAFSEKLTECMEAIEEQAGLTGIPARGSQPYESLVVERRVQVLADRRYPFTKMCDHLVELNRAMTLFYIVRMKDALKSLDGFYDELVRRNDERKLDNTELWLLKLFTDCKPTLKHMADKEDKYPNPKLEHLFHVILTHRDKCRSNNMDLRMMIFVKTKQITLAVLDWMKEHNLLADLNPAFFTGVRADTEKGGMSTQEQKTVLSKFEKGEHKVLISTSVGEEGIDIPDCSTCIRYEHVTNEISMIQSRGRVRQQAGNEVIIGESSTLEKDLYNLMLEEVMMEAMEAVTKMTKEEMRSQIKRIQTEAITEREDKEKRREERANTNQADEVRLLCKGCEEYLCSGSDLRLFKNTNHILAEPKFRQKIEFRDHPDAEKARKYNIKKIYCKKCETDWGNTANGYPCIKIESFIVEIHGDPEPKKFKKWKQVPFTIQPYAWYRA